MTIRGISVFILASLLLGACSLPPHAPAYHASWGGTTAVSGFDSLVKYYVSTHGGAQNTALSKTFLLSFRRTYIQYMAKQETGDGLDAWAAATTTSMLRDATPHLRLFARIELQKYDPQRGAFALMTPQQNGGYTFDYTTDNTMVVTLPYGTHMTQTRGVGIEKVTVTLDLHHWMVPVDKQMATHYIAVVTAYNAKRSVPMMMTYTPKDCMLAGNTLYCQGVVDHIDVYRTDLTQVNPRIRPDVEGIQVQP